MIRTSITAFFGDEDASAAMEYILIVALISVAWLYIWREYTAELTQIYDRIARDLRNVKIG
ncbi:hypothetical protein FDK21_03890 [Cohaesibacter sp. CAU 1516]|uniref:Flp family type IVb pilin n=1 Tax=Cohaesibacter sp. CAU 1516 TaxID=2576038 RepID=UPI0010FD6D12|nr:hypothetical protein [Cohaesibacter sp. CAU 1516]TLP48807.1 hypothetical protein FDK21_03890 [Cohaesibacter sp. CAU 1516]